MRQSRWEPCLQIDKFKCTLAVGWQAAWLTLLRLTGGGKRACFPSEKAHFEIESKGAGRTLGEAVERKRCGARQLVAVGDSTGGDGWLDTSAVVLRRRMVGKGLVCCEATP